MMPARVAGRRTLTLSLDADHIKGVLYNAGSTVFCAVQQKNVVDIKHHLL
jgi:hypothetical protein